MFWNGDSAAVFRSGFLYGRMHDIISHVTHALLLFLAYFFRSLRTLCVTDTSEALRRACSIPEVESADKSVHLHQSREILGVVLIGLLESQSCDCYGAIALCSVLHQRQPSCRTYLVLQPALHRAVSRLVSQVSDCGPELLKGHGHVCRDTL